MDSGDRPFWAARITREREARGWSKHQAVANLRLTYASMNRDKQGGSHESLLRQWRDWETGRVRPTHWAKYVAATFGTVEDDLFPVDPEPGQHLVSATGMDTAELIGRLRGSSVDDATLNAVAVTIDRLCTEYRFRPTSELRIEGQNWLRQITRLLDERMTYEQHREVLALAGTLALLVGCVEYDAGDHVAAEATRRFAEDLGAEIDNRDVMGWAHEMTAWFALTSGDYHRVIAASDHGTAVAGDRDVSVQLIAQRVKAWARLHNRRQVEIALDEGRTLLESLPRPSNPDHHFQIDPAKWHFYAMDAYRNVGEDAIATTYADEVLRLGTAANGQQRSPMRIAEAQVTLGVAAARAGDLNGAVEYGHKAL
ncbi:MAG: XRE family transcriptional regulator, partial [Nocardioidaceae bacterium]|nr:XRE family transcriptional regulator [Nocardioidaceae bacterium]